MEKGGIKLFRGGCVVTGEGLKKADVLVEGELIRAVGEPRAAAAGAAEVIDISGKLLFPGFLDAHTHFDLEVSGTVTADDFYSGSRAAAAGGTTAVLDFATQNRGETLSYALGRWHNKAEGKAFCDYGFHMAVSDWNETTERELADMVEAGITSFKLYMTYDNMILDDGSIYRVLKRIKELGGLAGVHCENHLLIQELIKEQKQAGHYGPEAHPLSRPACVEAEAVGRLLTIAELLDMPVMVVHVSSKKSLERIQAARKQGQTVFAETCPQYLLLDESYCRRPGLEGAKYVCSPPLRSRTDQECLWRALADGGIQTVSTDHCSFTLDQKAAGLADFVKIPNGMPGVEHRPVLMYSEGVKKGRISLEQMCRLLCENPARLYGMYPKKGVIAPGSDADLVVWDPEAEWTISKDNQHYRMDYCPYEGKRVTGRASAVYLRGRLAAAEGEPLPCPSGQFIKRNISGEALRGRIGNHACTI